MESQIPVVIEFFGNQCPPCRLLKPTLDSLAIEFEGRVKFVKINADEEPSLADYFDVGHLPALALVDQTADEKGMNVVMAVLARFPTPSTAFQDTCFSKLYRKRFSTAAQVSTAGLVLSQLLVPLLLDLLLLDLDFYA